MQDSSAIRKVREWCNSENGDVLVILLAEEKGQMRSKIPASKEGSIQILHMGEHVSFNRQRDCASINKISRWWSCTRLPRGTQCHHKHSYRTETEMS